MRIDVHAHYWPAAYLDGLAAAGRTALAFAGRQVDDFDRRLGVLDENDVDLQVLSAVGLNVELPSAAASAGSTRLINDINAEVVGRHPGRFAAFGSVPLPHVDAAIAETERCFDELDVAGIALPCIVDGKPIDHPDYEPFWENLGRRDTVVFVHPAGTDSRGHPGLDGFGLMFAFGSLMQISVAPLRVLYTGLSSRHPRLRFERNLRRGFEQSATAAAGRIFDYVQTLPVDRSDPLGRLREFWYDCSIQDVPAALLLTKECVGADRIVLGSDEIFASLGAAIAFVEDSPHLTDAEKTAVLDENAGLLLAPWLSRHVPTPTGS